MIVIKKDSWHYRYISRRYIPSANLCPYARQFFMSALASFCILALIVFVAGLIAGLVAAPLVYLADQYYHFTATWTPDNVNALKEFAIIGSAIYALASILVMAYTCMVVKEKYDDYRTDNPSGTPSEPSLVTLWFRDLHNKTCTQLKFE